MKLTINGRLPGLNEIIDASRANPRLGNALKQQAQNAVMWHIKTQMRGVTFSRPIRLHYMFYEPNRRRDKDNIASGAHKVIQDALVKMGVIRGDGWSCIDAFTDDFGVDKQNPRIEVTIEEADDGEQAQTARAGKVHRRNRS